MSRDIAITRRESQERARDQERADIRDESLRADVPRSAPGVSQGDIDASIAAHAAASDPHPTYTTAAELSTAIAAAVAALGAPIFIQMQDADCGEPWPLLPQSTSTATDPTAKIAARVAYGV